MASCICFPHDKYMHVSCYTYVHLNILLSLKIFVIFSTALLIIFISYQEFELYTLAGVASIASRILEKPNTVNPSLLALTHTSFLFFWYIVFC